METVFGVVLWVVILAVVIGRRSNRKSRAVQPRPRPAAARSAPSAKSRNPGHGGGPPPHSAIGGWLAGHAIAHGQTGFPGDPLPGGHLGSPANLAFWGGMFDDEDLDEDLDQDEYDDE